MTSHVWETLWWLLVAHALTDYALQPSEMATHKNPFYRGKDMAHGPWWWTMGAHALINGGGVALVTGSWILGVAETVVHGLMDTIKCSLCMEPQHVRVATWIDQGIHLLSKTLWALCT